MQHHPVHIEGTMDSDETFGGELPAAEAGTLSSVNILEAPDDYSCDEHEEDPATLASLLREMS